MGKCPDGRVIQGEQASFGKTPLLSVLVPAYNRELYLEACVGSVLRQPFQDLEVIIADNCSTDSTHEIAMRLAAADSRVKVIRHPRNLGPVPNWKSCLEKARGSYVHWLWSDDFINDSFYTTWDSFLDSKSGVDAVFCGGVDVLRDGAKQPLYRYRKGTCALRDLLSYIGDLPPVPVSPAAYILPAVSVRVHFYDTIPAVGAVDCVKYAIGVDLLMILGALADHGGVAHLHSAPCVNFRAHCGSISETEGDKLRVHYAFAQLWFLLAREQKVSVRQKIRIARQIVRSASGRARHTLLGMLFRAPTAFLSRSVK